MFKNHLKHEDKHLMFCLCQNTGSVNMSLLIWVLSGVFSMVGRKTFQYQYIQYLCTISIYSIYSGGSLLLRWAWLHDQEDWRGLRLHHGHLRGLPRFHQVRPVLKSQQSLLDIDIYIDIFQNLCQKFNLILPVNKLRLDLMQSWRIHTKLSGTQY